MASCHAKKSAHRINVALDLIILKFNGHLILLLRFNLMVSPGSMGIKLVTVPDHCGITGKGVKGATPTKGWH